MTTESKIVIVAVDDDNGHIELVRRNLRRAGCNNEIVALTTGSQALDFLFKRAEYADVNHDGNIVLLLDINIPGVFNGVEILRQIKASDETKAIPVIMLTTTSSPREVNRCYDLGCSAYVNKPVEPQEFIDTIQKLGQFISILRVPTLLTDSL